MIFFKDVFGWMISQSDKSSILVLQYY